MSRITHDICEELGLAGRGAATRSVSRKSIRLPSSPSASLRAKRIILAGGSGFLGGLLARHFTSRGCHVTILTRSSVENKLESENAFGPVNWLPWDGQTLGAWRQALEGADAVINLSGRSVNCRYHARNRRLMMDSRVDATRVIGEAITRATNPPSVWINLSTATIYRHTQGSAWDEQGEIGPTPEAKDAFSIEVATAWERAFAEATTPRTRKIALRLAMVFGLSADANNVYRVLRRLVKFGLGGPMGSGKQFVSWIHETDFCRGVEFLVENEALSGPVNLAAPNPVTNTEMMRTLRGLLERPLGLPAPAWLLEVGAFLLRTETELIIKSRRVIAGRLGAAGFEFRFDRLDDALCNLESRLATRTP